MALFYCRKKRLQDATCQCELCTVRALRRCLWIVGDDMLPKQLFSISRKKDHVAHLTGEVRSFSFFYITHCTNNLIFGYLQFYFYNDSHIK